MHLRILLAVLALGLADVLDNIRAAGSSFDAMAQFYSTVPAAFHSVLQQVQYYSPLLQGVNALKDSSNPMSIPASNVSDYAQGYNGLQKSVSHLLQVLLDRADTLASLLPESIIGGNMNTLGSAMAIVNSNVYSAAAGVATACAPLSSISQDAEVMANNYASVAARYSADIPAFLMPAAPTSCFSSPLTNNSNATNPDNVINFMAAIGTTADQYASAEFTLFNATRQLQTLSTAFTLLVSEQRGVSVSQDHYANSSRDLTTSLGGYLNHFNVPSPMPGPINDQLLLLNKESATFSHVALAAVKADCESYTQVQQGLRSLNEAWTGINSFYGTALSLTDTESNCTVPTSTSSRGSNAGTATSPGSQLVASPDKPSSFTAWGRWVLVGVAAALVLFSSLLAFMMVFSRRRILRGKPPLWGTACIFPQRITASPSAVENDSPISLASSSMINSCSICRKEFKSKELATHCQCGSLFHPGCLYEWRVTYETMCPTCCNHKAGV